MKSILLLIISVLFGFGIWYVIFWFVSNESNLFMWHWVTKIVYLILSFAASEGIFKGVNQN